jgi:hypothetical protein
MKTTDKRKLSPQQLYLLQRIPRSYDMNGYDANPIPKEVTAARKLLERYDKVEAKKQCEAKKRNEALIRKAQEAVYFDTPEKALAIVRQCEKLLKGCSV